MHVWTCNLEREYCLREASVFCFLWLLTCKHHEFNLNTNNPYPNKHIGLSKMYLRNVQIQAAHYNDEYDPYLAYAICIISQCKKRVSKYVYSQRMFLFICKGNKMPGHQPLLWYIKRVQIEYSLRYTELYINTCCKGFGMYCTAIFAL